MYKKTKSGREKYHIFPSAVKRAVPHFLSVVKHKQRSNEVKKEGGGDGQQMRRQGGR